MKAKITIQIGVYDKKPDDGYAMMRDPADLVATALEAVTVLDFKQTNTHYLPDGSVHLREFVAEVKGLV